MISLQLRGLPSESAARMAALDLPIRPINLAKTEDNDKFKPWSEIEPKGSIWGLI